MTQRAENNYRLALYQELDDIVSAMKNLAQVELVRLEKSHHRQQQVLNVCLEGLSTLQAHQGASLPAPQGPEVLIALGSERGFCGGFNEQIAQHFNAQQWDNTARILVIGSRLATKLPPQPGMDFLSAPASIDEALPAMQKIIDTLLQGAFPAHLTLLYHDRSAVQQVTLLPYPQRSDPPPACASLHIQLPAAELMQALQWQCLQQSLMLYLLDSLKTENRWRLQQMDGAQDHLEELSHDLRLRINAQRQQQIVEEIEVILSDQNFTL